MVFDDKPKFCQVKGWLRVVEVHCRVFLKKKLEKFNAAFTRKVRKTMIFWHFWPFLTKKRFFRVKKNFYEKNGRAIILKIFVPNIPENFRTIPWTVSEIKRNGRTDERTDERTNGRTDETDSIGPSRLKPGTKNRPHLLGNWPTKCFLNILNKKNFFFFLGNFSTIF